MILNGVGLLDGIISDAHGILTSEFLASNSFKVNSICDDIVTN